MNQSELIDYLTKKAETDPGKSGCARTDASVGAPDGSVYSARIYYIYKLALCLVRDKKEKAELQADFEDFCRVADTTPYDLGRGCQWVAEKCIEQNELDTAMNFLDIQLHDLNREAAKTVLSEENMLLFMMLEIALSERNNGSAKQKEGLFSKYDSVYEFKKPYTDIKLFTRRVWFGIPHKAEELESILDEYPVSGEMLSVIVKYSCVENVWCSVFEAVKNLLGEKYSYQKKIMTAYLKWLKSRNEGTKEKRRKISEIDNGFTVRRVYCEKTPAEEENPTDKTENRKKEDKLAIIFCTNDEQYEAETIRYLRTLKKPEKTNVIEVLPVWKGSSMASAYNYAMRQTDAKYKLFIHHDTFIFEPEMLNIVMGVLEEHPETGMVGVVGSLDLRDDAKWFSSDDKEKRLNVYQDAVINILTSVSVSKKGISEEAAVMDGIFLATQYDVPWNEEVFDNWHFYDISQCYEVRKAGYTCRLINGDDLFLLHETTMRKDPLDLYIKYQNIFIKNYLKPQDI